MIKNTCAGIVIAVFVFSFFLMSEATAVPNVPISPSQLVPGSVVVADGSLYALGYNQSCQLLVLNASTGSFLWNFPLGNQPMIWNLPVIGDKIIYVAGSDNRVFALGAADGRQVWTYEADQPLVISSELVNGIVYAGSQVGVVYALDATTGHLIWKTNPGKGPAASALGHLQAPLVENGRLYWEGFSGDSTLYSLDAFTGTSIWNFSSVGSRSAGNRIYFFSVSGDRIYATQFYDIVAINATTGLRVWNYTNGQISQPPVVMDNNVYTVSADRENHAVISIDANTGTQHWKFVPEQWGGHANQWLSPMVFSNHTLYFGTEHNGIYALDALNGKVRWNTGTGGDRVYHSPYLSENQILFAGDDAGVIYAINAVSGEKLWDHSIGYYPRSAPIESHAIVYAVRFDNRIFALNASTGKELWNYSTGDTPRALEISDPKNGLVPGSPPESSAPSHETSSPQSPLSRFMPLLGLSGIFILMRIRRK
jgi:outer membrane protein assembly factor BamB